MELLNLSSFFIIFIKMEPNLDDDIEQLIDNNDEGAQEEMVHGEIENALNTSSRKVSNGRMLGDMLWYGVHKHVFR